MNIRFILHFDTCIFVGRGFDSFWALVPTPLIIKVCANNSKLATEFVSHLVETYIHGFVRFPHLVAAEVIKSESDVC